MNITGQDQFELTELNKIERINNPTPEEFQRSSLSLRKPVIITGAMSGWKALSLWNFDYLSKTVGNTQVNVTVSQNRIFTGDPKKGFAFLKTTFSDFMSVILEQNKSTNNFYYLRLNQ